MKPLQGLWISFGVFCVPGVTPWKADYAPRSVSKAFELQVLVPPPLAAAPFDVSLDPDGVAVVEVREGKVLGFSPGGKPVEAGRGVEGPLFAHDGKGNLYSYSFPSGRVQVLERATGRVKTLGRVPEGHAGGAVAVTASGGRIWVLRRVGDGKGDLYFKARGKKGFRQVETGGIFLKGLAAVGERVFGLADGGVYLLTGKGPVRFVRFREPRWMDPGFAADGKGGFFVAFPERGRTAFAQADGKGRFHLLAHAPEGVVSGGIDYDPRRGRLWFVCKEIGGVGFLALGRRQGGRRPGKGKVVWIYRAGGVVTPVAVGVGPDGKVYVNGDEVGVYEFDRRWNPSVLYKGICCYQPPPADFVAETGGRLIYTAASPGFDGALLELRRGKRPRALYKEKGLFLPGGIARLGPGRYLVADYASGRLLEISRRGRGRVRDEGYRFPLGVAVAGKGAWYVTCSKPGRKGNPRSVLPLYPEILVRRYPGGRKEVVFDITGTAIGGSLFFLDVCPDGGVVFAAGGTVRRYDPASGRVTVLAEGMRRAAGVAAARNGDVYVTDYDAHALLRLRKL